MLQDKINDLVKAVTAETALTPDALQYLQDTILNAQTLESEVKEFKEKYLKKSESCRLLHEEVQKEKDKRLEVENELTDLKNRQKEFDLSELKVESLRERHADLMTVLGTVFKSPIYRSTIEGRKDGQPFVDQYNTTQYPIKCYSETVLQSEE